MWHDKTFRQRNKATKTARGAGGQKLYKEKEVSNIRGFS